MVLGLIDPKSFAGGSIELAPGRAREALAKDIGMGLGLDPETSAHAVHEIVCENMASAARVHAVERGAVIGQHTLVAFGGAAPLHAARVAEKIGVSRVIIPQHAGVGSAIGFLAAPIAYEVIKSRHARLDKPDASGWSQLLAEMSREGRAIVEPGARGMPLYERRIAFMRYVGQGHEITVPLPVRDLVEADAASLREAFEAEYAALFKRFIPGAPIEILSWSVLVSTESKQPDRASPSPQTYTASRRSDASLFRRTHRKTVQVPLYQRDQMLPGARVAGPAIIAEAETSTFISATFDAQIDQAGSIVMDRKP